jgi:hypothetical protein
MKKLLGEIQSKTANAVNTAVKHIDKSLTNSEGPAAAAAAGGSSQQQQHDGQFLR